LAKQKGNNHEVVGMPMTRKTLINALSIIYIFTGLWHILIFLHLSTVLTGFINFDLTRLVGGVLALYVGFHLLRFDEFGRKLAVFLLCVRVAINSYFLVWFLTHREGVVSTGIYFLKQEIYRIANPYASEVFLVAWILVALLTIVFLSQGATKKIFTAAKTNDSEVMVESPQKEAS
jgi:hypothetical protein